VVKIQSPAAGEEVCTSINFVHAQLYNQRVKGKNSIGVVSCQGHFIVLV
jgi:hypothetical protein